jgi:DNA-binding LacI/PurR family transcriptional regulator
MLAGRYFKNTGRKNPAYIGGFLDRKKKKGFSEGLADSGEKVFFGEGGCSFEDGHAAFR